MLRISLLIILLLAISGNSRQYTSAEKEQFYDEKHIIPESSMSISKYENEISHNFRILADTPTSPSGLQFCVANLDADPNALQDGLNWACGQGMADCKAIQQGGACYQPNNLTALASYAYNDYYQRTKATGGTCNFSNTAHLTPSDPSYGSCIFTGSLNTNTGTNSSFNPSPPAFIGSPSNGLSPPFSLNNSASELHILQMPHLLLVFFYYFYLVK